MDILGMLNNYVLVPLRWTKQFYNSQQGLKPLKIQFFHEKGQYVGSFLPKLDSRKAQEKKNYVMKAMDLYRFN